VLAIVDDFASARMKIRRSAAAQVAAALKDGYAKACVGQGAGGCQPGDTTSDNGDGVLLPGTLVFDGTEAERGDGSCSLF
jgi:hypothetical protein